MKYILGVISLAALLLGVVHANECVEENLNACEEKFDAQADTDDEDCSLFENAANCVRQATAQCEATEEDLFGIEFVALLMEGIQEACEEYDDDDATEKRFFEPFQKGCDKKGPQTGLPKGFEEGI